MSTSLFDQLDAGYKRLDEDIAWLPDEPHPRATPGRNDRDDREADGRDARDAAMAPVPDVGDTAALADVPVEPEDFEEHADMATPDPDAVRRAWPVWGRRILVVLVVFLVLSVIAVVVSGGLRQAHARRAGQRLDTSVAALRTADGKAQDVRKAVGRDELDDAGLYDQLSARIDANALLLKSVSTDLDADGLDAMAVRVDEATASTDDLTGKVSQSREAKTLASARASCEDALRQAKDKLSSTESNETTEPALGELRAAVDQAGDLDDEAKAGDWSKAGQRLTEAMGKVDDAVRAKQQADETARAQAEAEQQAQSQQAQPEYQQYQSAPQQYQSTPQQQYQSTPQQQYQSAPSQTPQSSGGSSSDGWSVPAPDNGTSLPGSDSSL